MQAQGFLGLSLACRNRHKAYIDGWRSRTCRRVTTWLAWSTFQPGRHGAHPALSPSFRAPFSTWWRQIRYPPSGFAEKDDSEGHDFHDFTVEMFERNFEPLTKEEFMDMFGDDDE